VRGILRAEPRRGREEPRMRTVNVCMEFGVYDATTFVVNLVVRDRPSVGRSAAGRTARHRTAVPQYCSPEHGAAPATLIRSAARRGECEQEQRRKWGGVWCGGGRHGWLGGRPGLSRDGALVHSFARLFIDMFVGRWLCMNHRRLASPASCVYTYICILRRTTLGSLSDIYVDYAARAELMLHHRVKLTGQS